MTTMTVNISATPILNPIKKWLELKLSTDLCDLKAF